MTARPISWKIFNSLIAIAVAFVAGFSVPVNLESYTWMVAGSIGGFLVLNLFSGKILQRSLPIPARILPIFFLLGLFGAMAAISQNWIRFLVGVGGAIWLYAFQIREDQHSSESFSLVTAFLLLLSVWSVNFFFSPPWWAMIMALSLSPVIVLWLALSDYPLTRAEKSIWSLVVFIILAEVSWTILLLPLHYFSTAVASFSIFYLLFIFSFLYFTERITRKRILFHSVLAGALVLASFLSSPFTPLR